MALKYRLSILLALILCVILWITLNGCITAKNAPKKVAIISVKNPGALAKYCADKYNNVVGRDSVVLTKIDTLYETDSTLIYDTLTNSYLKTVRYKYRYYYYITKTITNTLQNTAALDTMRMAYEAEKAKVHARDKTIAAKTSTNRILWWVAGCLAFLWIVFIIIKILTLKYSKAKKIVT